MAGSRSLGDLDDNAIEEILCRLPIKDAARTSVLSRRWRRSWLSNPVLDLSDLHRSQIDRILSQCSDHPIRVFLTRQLIRMSTTPDSDVWRSTDVERWLTTLSLHSASSLRTLVLLLYYFSCDLNLISRCFPDLTRLELSGPLSVPLHLQGFATLRELHLKVFTPPRYTYDDDDDDDDELDWDGLSRLISACPLLETLDFNAPNLVSGPLFSLDINAPNLRRLNLFDSLLSHFSVTSAPLLETVIMNSFDLIEVEEEEDGEGEGEGNVVGGDTSSTASCNLMKVLGGMANIKKLEANHPTLEFLAEGHVPERIPLCFNNLRMISLQVKFGDSMVMLVVRCLLRSCPNLKELVMDGGHSYKDNTDIWEMEAQEDMQLFNNLEILGLKLTKCTRHELGFVKFVLAKARILKTVKISFHRAIGEKYLLAANLLEFPRNSTQARILLTDDE